MHRSFFVAVLLAISTACSGASDRGGVTAPGLESAYQPDSSAHQAATKDTLAASLNIEAQVRPIDADIVKALSGVEVAAIDETEFSRLYVVARTRAGTARVVAARC